MAGTNLNISDAVSPTNPNRVHAECPSGSGTQASSGSDSESRRAKNQDEVAASYGIGYHSDHPYAARLSGPADGPPPPPPPPQTGTRSGVFDQWERTKGCAEPLLVQTGTRSGVFDQWERTK